jgi:hypothetical protein
MAQPITDLLANQCGNCSFWEHIPRHPAGNAGECCGVAPTPILVAMKPRAIGMGVDMQFENVRPIMAANARPCAHHKRAEAVILKPKGPVSQLNS